MEIKKRQWGWIGYTVLNQHPALQNRPYHGIHRARGREKGQGIHEGTTS